MAIYLRNSWYMIAWANELANGMMSRTVMDERILVYRKEHGGFVALEDRCPHRFARLSKGSLKDDKVVCGYHGLTFDETGECVANPFAASPPRCRVRSYPVLERHGSIWIWMGSPALADAGRLPDLSCLALPKVRPGYYPLQASYRLLVDNILDLSHVEFVHKGTFGGTGMLLGGTFTSTIDGDVVVATWDSLPAPIDELTAAFMGVPESTGRLIDRWAIVRWQPASIMTLELGGAWTGVPREEGTVFKTLNLETSTPESSTTSHYFYSWPPMDPEPSELYGGLDPVADEDAPIMASCQSNMGGEEDFWSLKPVVLPNDSGGVTARRRLEHLIARENQETKKLRSTSTESS
jgi:phenylpropionate dioxygenase-like ring-hydroxylating dioxygenase large terminal subunit